MNADDLFMLLGWVVILCGALLVSSAVVWIIETIRGKNETIHD